jgi:hypothetical protein
MKKISILTIVLSGMLAFIFSCKKKFDHPPLKTVNEGAKVKISALKSRVPSDGSYYKFGNNDTTLFGVVVADESSGNIYKQIFLMDDNGDGIQVNLRNSGGLATGDFIRINLNGLYLANYKNMIYLDSVDLGKSVVKHSSGNVVDPIIVTVSQINAGTIPTNSNSLQSKLVKIEGVEFAEKNQTYADAITKQDLERTLQLCGQSSNSVLVRSSGYANFANTKTPAGSGYIIAIVTQYSSEMQLTIRDIKEVQMSGTGCPPPPPNPPPTFTLAAPVSSLSENFTSIATTNQTFTSNGWMNWAEVGNVIWKTNINGSAKAMKATSYGSGQTANTMWLISRPITYNAAQTLTFKTGFEYWDAGHTNAVMAYISTNFNGSNVTTANWTPITSATYANGTGSFYTSMVNSGTVNLNTVSILSGYSGNFHLAFKYSGTSTLNSNIYVDDIIVQ